MKISNTYTNVVKIIIKLFIICQRVQPCRQCLGPNSWLLRLLTLVRLLESLFYANVFFAGHSAFVIPEKSKKSEKSEFCCRISKVNKCLPNYCNARHSLPHTQEYVCRMFLSILAYFGPLVFQQLHIPRLFFF